MKLSDRQKVADFAKLKTGQWLTLGDPRGYSVNPSLRRKIFATIVAEEVTGSLGTTIWGNSPAARGGVLGTRTPSHGRKTKK
jgi:hypothetical protein